MFRKKLLAMGLVTTIALCGLSGCTSNITTVPQETTPPEITSGQEETSTEEEKTTTEEPTSEEETVGGVMGYVDAEDICKHISINGKVVEFPWTLNELGEEYTFDYVYNSSEEGYFNAEIMYEGDNIISVGIFEQEEVNTNSIIYSISYGINSGVNLYNFNKDTTIEALYERLGLPNKTNVSELLTDYVYETEDIFIQFTFLNNSKKLSDTFINLKQYDLED